MLLGWPNTGAAEDRPKTVPGGLKCPNGEVGDIGFFSSDKPSDEKLMSVNSVLGSMTEATVLLSGTTSVTIASSCGELLSPSTGALPIESGAAGTACGVADGAGVRNALETGKS